jgi:DNA-binding NarL/FixJ family response regulator
MRIRVLLADDHAITLEGLRRLLREPEDMEVVGQAGDGRTAVELTNQLLPDVVLIDIGMPALDGIEATKRIHQTQPAVGIIALSVYPYRIYVREMFRAGARGHLLKDCDHQDLLTAIRTVAAGGTYTSPRIDNDPKGGQAQTS